MNENITIVSLNKYNLKQAIRLANSVFSDEESCPSTELKASVSAKKFKHYCRYCDAEVLSLDYYVALQDNSVVGLIGLYTLKEDCKDTAWLGWYCVDKKERGKGIGEILLEFAISKARQMDKKHLCLYTSTDKKEQTAQLIYEKYGFNITFIEKRKGYDILFRQKVL